MSSIASNASGISVSLWGIEQDFDAAVDEVMRGVQSRINGCHCKIRELAQCEERADTYMEASEIHFDIIAFLSELGDLFKDLASCSKQALGPCPKELKTEFAEYVAKRKKQLVDAKAQLKLDRATVANAPLDSIKE